jgi:hypothetical protein
MSNFSICKNMDEVLKQFLAEEHEPDDFPPCDYCKKEVETQKYLVKDTSRTTKDICKQCHKENSMWLEGIL